MLILTGASTFCSSATAGGTSRVLLPSHWWPASSRVVQLTATRETKLYTNASQQWTWAELFVEFEGVGARQLQIYLFPSLLWHSYLACSEFSVLLIHSLYMLRSANWSIFMSIELCDKIVLLACWRVISEINLIYLIYDLIGKKLGEKIKDFFSERLMCARQTSGSTPLAVVRLEDERHSFWLPLAAAAHMVQYSPSGWSNSGPGGVSSLQ